MVAPFLHPRDRANLPLIARSLQSQFSVIFIWIVLLLFATGWYVWGFKRDQWMSVFAALTVSISASLYFTNALFHPLIAQERTYKPFMLGVRSTVKDAPLYFYQDASDYGAIFYAGRHIADYSQAQLSEEDGHNVDSPLYLLVREKDWPDLAGTHPHLERLVTSEGQGPDKKHRLVLAALLSQKNNGQNDQMEHGVEQSEADESPPDESPLPESEQVQSQQLEQLDQLEQLEKDGETPQDNFADDPADDPGSTTSEDTDES